MRNGFLAWWVRHLGLPSGQAVGGAMPRRVLLLEPHGQPATHIDLTLRRRRRAGQPLGRCGLDESSGPVMRQALRTSGRVPVVLRLPPGALLEREVVLPLAAERDIRGTLRHELDRLTPFRPDEAYWTWDVIRRDRLHGRLHLRLFLVPRASVAGALAVPAAAGAPASLLQARCADETWRTIALAEPETPRWQRHAVSGVAVACAAMALAVVATPFIHQSVHLSEIEERIAALQPAVREAAALRQRSSQEAASGDAVAMTQAESGNALRILAAVTGILPDDTSLSGFTMKQRQMTLRGQSTNAARLIVALAADPAVRNPAFAAPITRAAGGGPELFAITAEAAP